MEFVFDVNQVLPDEISLIRGKDVVADIKRGYIRDNKELQIKLNLSKIIDDVGVASSKAQNLRGAITSSLRLKSFDHHLYLFKDSNANNGFGCVIGMIRVGLKHLFLLDIYGQQHECRPLCVLDFYVHESKQRHGYGKIIFEHMLRSEQVQPHELAIDRPSVKFINFLSRHYSLVKPIHQMNKFIVFESFFKDMAAVGGVDVNRRRSAPVSRKVFQRLSSDPTSSACTDNRRTTLSRQLSALPPINMNSGSTDDNDIMRPMRSSHRTIQQASNTISEIPIVRHHQKESQMRTYSRHSAEQNSGKPLQPPCTLQNVSAEKLDERQALNTETHALRPCLPSKDHRLTSLDSPFTDTDSNMSKGDSYTMNKVLAAFNCNKEKLGTGWNVFGVPNTNLSSNPYSSMKRMSYPR